MTGHSNREPKQLKKVSKGKHSMNRRERFILRNLLGLLSLIAVLLVPFATASAQVGVGASTPTLQSILGNPPATAPGQSATLLPDGQWLLLGGTAANGQPVAIAKLLDVATGTTETLSQSLVIARTAHTATLLPNGMVIVLGGMATNGQIADIEVFDTHSGMFGTGAEIGLLPRAMHTATLLTDGRLLVVGGVDASGQVLDDIEIYDPSTGAIDRFNGKLDTARFGHVTALLPSDSTLVWGGLGKNNEPLEAGALFDPATKSFARVGSPSDVLPQSAAGIAPPTVAATNPPHGMTDVPVVQTISVRFGKALNVESLNDETVTLFGPSGPVASDVVPAAAGLLMFVTPKVDLAPRSTYTLFIKGAVDQEGRPLPFTAVSFTTAQVGDTAATAVSTSPQVITATSGAATTPGTTGGATTSNSANPALNDKKTVASATTDSGQAGQATSPASVQPSDDDELWIPGPEHFHGRWRINRSAPIRAKALPQAPEGVTALAGEVRRMNGLPLANVTLRIGAIETRTDNQGQFLLAGVPDGTQMLEIDARSANRPRATYGIFLAQVQIESQQTTNLPYTIWMPKLDPQGYVKIASPTTVDTVITTAAIPGLELRIPAGTVIRDRDGKIVTEINITAIPTDRPPFPLPGFGVPVYFTVQPGGAWLQGINAAATKGAQLVYPNYAGEVPSALGAFWNYDARDKGWYIYGMGKVSADGRQVVPDPDVAFYEFTGAMFNNSPPPPPGPPPCNSHCCAPPDPPPPGGGGGGGSWTKNPNQGAPDCGHGGDPVDLAVGQFTQTERDLWLPDVMPIDLTRSYRGLDLNKRSFGVGMSHPYDIFLWSAHQYQEVDVILPSGSRVHYVRINPGTTYGGSIYESSAPGQWAKSQIAETGGGWTLTFRDGRKWHFPYFQPLDWMSDANGNITTIARRDGNEGPVSRITSPNGRTIQFTADSSDRITSAQDNTGRTFTYTYDTSGQLATVTDPAGGQRIYAWDSSHRLVSVRDPNGNLVVQNTYDANSRVTAQVEADGSQFQYAYFTDVNGKVVKTELTDRRGNVRRVEFDGNGYVVKNTFPVGQPEEQVTSFEVDSTTGWMLSTTDALGRKTAYMYDTFGNRMGVTRLAGTANAVTTTATYTTAFNQLASFTDPLNQTTTFSYDPKGNLSQITAANGNTRSYTYDGQGRRTGLTDGLGHTWTVTYAGADIATLTDPLNRTRTLFADAVGRVVSSLDAMGNFYQSGYDSLNRLMSMTDPLGNTVSVSYDANGNITSYTDPRGSVTQYTYNALSKVATRTDPLSQVETYTYDVAGLPLALTDRKGQVSGLTYDNRNRRLMVGFGATTTSPTNYTSTMSYVYDAGDRVMQIVDSVGGTISRSYDDLNRLTVETTPQGSVSYGYDAAGRRTTLTVAGQAAVAYTYDSANRLTQIAQSGQTVTFSYDAANRRTSTTLPNGISINYDYDNANQLVGITYVQAATTLGNLTYTYDANGRRTSTGGTLATTDLPVAVSSATYNANNQIISWNGATFSYDLNGNLLGTGTDTYAWDARNQLAGISGANSGSFEYDAQRRRVSKTVNGVQTGYLYDGANYVQELSASIVKSNLLTGQRLDEVFARTVGSATTSYLTDGLGSVVGLADGNGTVTTQYTYEPYGGTTSAGTASDNAQQYSGRENDGTGLYYYRHRYYMPKCGRFISEDPAGVAGGLNLYGYVMGNPMSFIDPQGLFATCTNAGGQTQVTIPITYWGEGNSSDVTDAWDRAIERYWSSSDFVVNVVRGPQNNVIVDPGDGRAVVIGGDRGVWYAGAESSDWVAGHEGGHLMGLPDLYTDINGDSKAFPGAEGTMMATRLGVVTGDDRNAARGALGCSK
jgi:RHS repeat-associated protein